MTIKRYSDMHEGIRTSLLTALLSLGISPAYAQKFNSPKKKELIDTIYRYNLKPTGLSNLKLNLHKHVENPDLLMNYIEMQPDRTVILKPEFIPNLDLIASPDEKSFGARYTIKF